MEKWGLSGSLDKTTEAQALENTTEAQALENTTEAQSLEQATEALLEKPETTEVAEAPEEADLSGLAASLEPQLFYVEENKPVIVTGDPFGKKDLIDFAQGDNPFGAAGNCGLVSISNALRRMGVETSENEVTFMAIAHKLCAYDPGGSIYDNGGTNIHGRQALLTELGMKSDVLYANNGGTAEVIANAVDSGCGVVMSVNAGQLWNSDDGSGPIPRSNHCVAVTGVVRDAATGEITGFVIADSGRELQGDACRILSMEEFDDCYTNVTGTGVNIIYPN